MNDPFAQELIKWLLGGGAGLILAGLYRVIKDRRKGKVLSEDTAVERYKELRALQVEETAEENRYHTWYRDHYVALWTETVKHHPEKASEYPVGPPSDINARSREVVDTSKE